MDKTEKKFIKLQNLKEKILKEYKSIYENESITDEEYILYFTEFSQ